MTFELKMPDLSTTGSPIKVLRWLVAVGDFVERGQALLDVETDKATMEVEALNSGKLLEQLVSAGQEASAGEVLAIIGEASAQSITRTSESGHAEEPYDRDLYPSVSGTGSHGGWSLCRAERERFHYLDFPGSWARPGQGTYGSRNVRRAFRSDYRLLQG